MRRGAGPVPRVAGTPEYLAPERATGALHPTLAARMDVYSLGVMAFEMLTYRRLFSTDSPSAQIDAHVNAPTPRLRTFRPDLPVELEAVILRALEKDPRARTPSCLALRSELLATAEQMLSKRPAARVRVLLVSHEDALRARLSELLNAGLEQVDVALAAASAEARQMLEHASADLVLLDLALQHYETHRIGVISNMLQTLTAETCRKFAQQLLKIEDENERLEKARLKALDILYGQS